MSLLSIDETTRAQLRQLRLSTFADVYFELAADEEMTNALPEEIFLKAVAKLPSNAILPKPSPMPNSATLMPHWQS